MPLLLTRSFFLFLLLFATAELLMRTVFQHSMEGRFDYGYHPTAGIYERDDGRVDLLRTGGRRFFPQHFARVCPQDVFRVMVVGDSVARGTSVADCYTGHLQAQLRARGLKAECISLALPGFGARRKDLLVEQALRFQPDVVVLHVGMTNEFEDEREWNRKNEFASAHPRHWLMHSHFLRLLHSLKSQKVNGQLLPRAVLTPQGGLDAEAEEVASRDPARLKVWEQRAREVTAKSVKRAVDAGVKLLIVNQATRVGHGPSAWQLNDSKLAWTHAFSAPSVRILDMKTAFPSETLDALFIDSSHIRPEGHRRLAESILAELERSAWLPPAGS